MKFAHINGQRREAQPGLSGTCPVCERPMVAKCGEFKAWHWAHKGRHVCDAWWENETDWHRNWKDQFPGDWQEFVQHAEDGERHIADVKTDQGWVLEFQHSYIKPEERRSREAFYSKLLWMVHGLRRKRDRAQFLKAVEEGTPVGASSPVRKVLFPDECRLLREWARSPAPVFFDFGGEQVLWWVLAGTPSGSVYVAPFPRAQFIGIHRGAATQDFDSFVEELPELVAKYESHHRTQASMPVLLEPLQSLAQYSARRSRNRRRL